MFCFETNVYFISHPFLARSACTVSGISPASKRKICPRRKLLKPYTRSGTCRAIHGVFYLFFITCGGANSRCVARVAAFGARWGCVSRLCFSSSLLRTSITELPVFLPLSLCAGVGGEARRAIENGLK
jgi:hypothetical protein